MLKIDFPKLKLGLNNGLTSKKVQNIEQMLKSFNAVDLKSVGVSQKTWQRFVAYMFATAWHETATTMAPIEEYGKGRNKTYGTWYLNSKQVAYCFKNGRKLIAYLKKDYPHLYYGRGYVQLTWFDNYALATKKLGKDLLNKPELALEVDIATDVMIYGMLYGWFTGVKLSDFISDAKKDYINARKIINGTDKAKMIAEYAEAFESALSY